MLVEFKLLELKQRSGMEGREQEAGYKSRTQKSSILQQQNGVKVLICQINSAWQQDGEREKSNKLFMLFGSGLQMNGGDNSTLI